MGRSAQATTWLHPVTVLSYLLQGIRNPHVASLRSSAATDPYPRRQRFCKLIKDEVFEAAGPRSFKTLALLGKGSFGEVYKVQHKSTGNVFAMKVLRKSRILNSNLVRYVMTERNLLSYLRHPFIVRLHFAFQTPSSLVLVLQYCPGGNLGNLVAREGCLPEELAKHYSAEVYLAIEHLHERQVLYRDLKPENVVLDSDAHALLIDFGLSKQGVEGIVGTNSFCGSVAYLAPELLSSSRNHGHPVDLYGLGVLLFEMLEGRPPFYNRNREQLFVNIMGAPLKLPSRASPKACELISALMQRDASLRPGARCTFDLRSHPFFADVDFEQVLRREVPVPPLSGAANGLCDSADHHETTSGVPRSPFEGRLHTKMCWSASAEDIEGWDFSTPAPRPLCNPEVSDAAARRRISMRMRKFGYCPRRAFDCAS